jgi:hypothetical protein
MNDNEPLISLMVPFHVTVERVKDLLTCAFEGGSNYWIESAIRRGEATDRKKAPFLCDAPFVSDGYLQVKEDGSEANHGMGGWFNINPETIKTGLTVFAQKHPKHFADFVNENDDAETGDMFLQCVCFGEVIYG